MPVQSKAMQVDDVRSTFAAQVASPVNQNLDLGTSSARASAYTDQIQTDGEMDANALNQLRSGKYHFYDDAANRGKMTGDLATKGLNGADVFSPKAGQPGALA